MNLFGIELKYIIMLLLVIMIVISGIKKLFKLALIIGLLTVAYYLYTMFF